MAFLKCFVHCLSSPRFFKFYGIGQQEGFTYEPKLMERWGDVVIKSFWVLLNLRCISLPVLGVVLYRRCYVALTGLGLLLAASYGLRAAGRSTNEAYLAFLHTLMAARQELNSETKKSLMRYDFEFDAWPVEFKFSDVVGDDSKHRLFVDQPAGRRGSTTLERVLSFPCRAISYIVANTFGYKLMFPGSIQFLQFCIDGSILQGRTKLMEENRAQRFKLRTREGNELDSVFVDRRKKDINGNTLVICCEGNAGFYEIGIMVTPLEAGYSVLGWNYPGFGWSSGTPYPDHVTNGVDTILQFAINKLNFLPENIILFGWSIGGYPVTWAGMNYPELKGLILDASFDDVLPLAVTRFPSSWDPLIRRVIRDYMNLNNTEQLSHYSGPVLLVRRTEDEIIALEPSILGTNRGNNLLIQLLRRRYPRLVEDKALEELHSWLDKDPSGQSVLWNKYQVDEDRCTSALIAYISEHSNSYPMLVGETYNDTLKIQMTLFLARKYLVDYSSTHCTPLPSSLFQMPWELSPELEYVKL